MFASLHQRVLAVAAVTALCGCAAPVAMVSQLGAGDISPEMLLNGSPIAAAFEQEDVGDVDILELTPAMKAFLDERIRDRQDEKDRLRALIYAVIVEGTFNLVYDESTRTAGETFEDQHGNCLSFTNMFISMARYVGLEAHYQEVDVPPDWSLAGESFLLSKHVNAILELSYGERIVDFNVYDFKITFDKNVISDQRGRAHYFNNLGVEQMLAGDSALAVAHLRQSLREDATFTPAWINMGILHRREGHPDYAEAAYLQALRTERNNLVAMSNLASLYDEEGLTEFASVYKAQVEAHRMQNPYYRYMLANEAFVSGDYRTAIEHLDYAISARKNEDRFLSLMSMSYLMLGDREAAQGWMKKAEAAASEDRNKQRYHHKLELLLGRDYGA
ncbi:MAG: transglutaminase domain-containing protein [Lysobacterales bacterium]